MGRTYSAIIGRNGDGGGMEGSGFEAGYAGGGCDGCGRRGEGRGGAIMVAMLDSDRVGWTVMFVQDVDGRRDKEEVRGGKECATSAGAES
jgi:hypothetical protein